ncbi:Imm51 family immunity protein [Breznakiellaceae bacterium SP9]
MDKALEKKLEQLAEQNEFGEIVEMIERIPENERDMEIVGRYVRALNNTEQLQRAVEVSLQYKEQGEKDPLWHYRLGYAYVYLRLYDEAEAVLLRAKELAKDDVQTTEWIEKLLEQLTEEKEERAEKAESEARRRAGCVPRDASTAVFEGFDFSDFWNDSDYALKQYVGGCVTDEQFADAEKELGYKLPASYKHIIKQHNGGIPKRNLFVVPFAGTREPDAVYITGIMGVDSAKSFSLLGELGNKLWIEDWGYPDIGVAICDTISGGHDMVFLDYRNCGPQGEPEVVHIDQESDYEITYLAGDFESFIRGLVPSDEYDADDADKEDNSATARYTAVVKHTDSISVCFYIEHDKPMSIGAKMNEINDEAYMNGYNWEAFFNYYLPKYAPDVAEGMKTDPEAGMYAAYYSLTSENEGRAEKFKELIIELIENEEELYRIVREEGSEIGWD